VILIFSEFLKLASLRTEADLFALRPVALAVCELLTLSRCRMLADFSSPSVGVQIGTQITSLYTILLGLSFIFKSAASNAFDSVVSSTSLLSLFSSPAQADSHTSLSLRSSSSSPTPSTQATESSSEPRTSSSRRCGSSQRSSDAWTEPKPSTRTLFSLLSKSETFEGQETWPKDLPWTSDGELLNRSSMSLRSWSAIGSLPTRREISTRLLRSP